MKALSDLSSAYYGLTNLAVIACVLSVGVWSHAFAFIKRYMDEDANTVGH